MSSPGQGSEVRREGCGAHHSCTSGPPELWFFICVWVMSNASAGVLFPATMNDSVFKKMLSFPWLLISNTVAVCTGRVHSPLSENDNRVKVAG